MNLPFVRAKAALLLFGLFGLFGVVLSGCSSLRIQTHQDPKVDVSQYRTYRWLTTPDAKALHLENPPEIDFLTAYSNITQRPDVEPELKASIDRDLQAKGYRETDGVPDFYVSYYGKAKDQDWISTWTGRVPSINNVPLVMYPDYLRQSARTYREGDLVLVFYDSKTKSPAWTGVMLHVLDQKRVDMPTITADLGELVDRFKSSA